MGTRFAVTRFSYDTTNGGVMEHHKNLLVLQNVVDKL
jgi:hypothetical protein